jgi:hypothetical protein
MSRQALRFAEQQDSAIAKGDNTNEYKSRFTALLSDGAPRRNKCVHAKPTEVAAYRADDRHAKLIATASSITFFTFLEVYAA